MSLKDIRKNPLLLTDGYNLGHQSLKINSDLEVSNLVNRVAPMVLYGFHESVKTFMDIKIEHWMVDEAVAMSEEYGSPFPENLFRRMIDECNGTWPIRIESIPEGTYVPTGTPFAQIRNTKDGFGELCTYVEAIFMHAYFPSSCATRAFEMYRYLQNTIKDCGLDESFMYRFHSFGFRGHHSLEDAYWAGTAWSMFLPGTDDFHIKRHFPRDWPIHSIMALAHKVTQQFDKEFDCFVHAIDTVHSLGKKIVAVVIDTYNADNVIDNFLVSLCSYAKQKDVTLVFRPDSGDVFGQAVRIYKNLNKAGYDNFSIIIGEGMSFEKAVEYDIGFALANVPLTKVFYGIGAGYYKDLERDTLGWAQKTSYSNGKNRMKLVKSNPLKQSIPGVIRLVNTCHGVMVETCHENSGANLLKVIYNDGVMEPVPGFKEIKENAINSFTGQQRIVLSRELEIEIEHVKANIKKYNAVDYE